MLSKSESRYFSKKRNNYSWIVVSALILGGLAFLVLAFSLFRSEEEIDPEQVERHIETHASAEGRALTDTPAVIKAPTPAESGNAQNAANPQPPKKAVQPPVPQPQDAGTPANTPQYLSAYKSLLALPVCQGCTAPKAGKYRLSDKPIEYSKNASPEAIAAAQAKKYTVVSGDILGRIASKHGCTIEQLQRANRMSNDQIKIGQRLLIPDCSSGEEIIPLVAEPVLPEIPRGNWWKSNGVNSTALPAMMKAEGFKPPKQFMAFVIELTFDPTRQYVTKERAFDYNGTSLKTDWNPASTVKLFAAIGALKRIEELGFSSRAKVTFNGKHPYTEVVSKLIEMAIIQSDNIAYNRVAQLASFEKLHTEILTSKYGIARTALNRGYELKKWESMGEDPSLRVAPEIILTEGKKTHKIPASNSKAGTTCTSTACTTLQDLGEITRRLMLQEQLQPTESFNLAQPDLIMLRRAMRSEERERGTEMVDRFSEVFKDPRVKFYSKPGFAGDWYTDNVYIFDPRYNQAWIVVMSGYPGRQSLNSAASALAKIISSGKLRAAK